MFADPREGLGRRRRLRHQEDQLILLAEDVLGAVSQVFSREEVARTFGNPRHFHDDGDDDDARVFRLCVD